MTSAHARGRRATAVLALLTATLVPGLTHLPAFADEGAPAPAPLASSTPSHLVSTLGDAVVALTDIDVRSAVRPSPAQLRAVAALGDVQLRWNAAGTPSSILPADGTLARATSSDPEVAARAWISDHATLLGLSTDQVDALELVSSQEFAQSPARAVLFRQRFDGLIPAVGGLVTVGVARGEIAYVSSSLSKATGTPADAVLSPLQGWLKAAASVGRAVPVTSVPSIVRTVSGGWTRLTVPGLVQQQVARLRVLPMSDGTVRPVIQSNVVDMAATSVLGYTVLVDAVTGQVLWRHNQVQNDHDTEADERGVTASPLGFSPRWSYFTANPSMNSLGDKVPGNAVVGCWVAGEGCTSPTGPFANVAAVTTWDAVNVAGLSSM
ncbi:MAG: hypothetical protein F2667_14635, partial [Actinobacteria bacterium]|nr:hypothetical protein [Actinomycetota bacterium]